MFKRLLALFLILIGVLSAGVYAECFFDSLDSTCDSFSTPFNSFNLNFDSIDNLDSFEAQLFFKSNPSNKLRIVKEVNTIRNINPFLESGVYVLKVTATNKAGVLIEKNFEFVFDNNKPAPPIVDLNLYSNTDSVIVKGIGKFGNTILSTDLNGQSVTSTIGSNGEFQTTLSLVNGLNHFNFYQINSNGLKSEPIERLIEFKSSVVSSSVSELLVDDLVSNNFRTYNDAGVYITSKRNFYVSGQVPESLRGENVHVNGVLAKVDNLNNFGAFVLLNEGDNRLKIQAAGSNTFVEVKYIEPRFKFLSLNLSKVTSVDSFDLSGTVNYDIPFNVYVNGKFISEVISQNGIFDEVISNLVIGKNYIYLEGFNGENIEEIVYYDNNLPQIELSKDKLAYSNQLVFKIDDDTGVDISQVKVEIGPYSFHNDDFTVKGDFYIVDVSSVEDGEFNYLISAIDRAGNIGEISGILSIDKTNTLFEKFDVENGYVLGNNIFTTSGKKRLSLSPSRYIAFEKIYLDGVEQIDYEIKANSDVELFLDFKLGSGILEFTYIDNSHNSFSEFFNYYTDEEKPVIDLDYVRNSYSVDSKLIKVSGEVIDSHFDWSTLNFNSKNNYLRYGNYFEAFVPVGSENLEFSGRDHSLNEIDNSMLGGIFTKDIRDTSVLFTPQSKNSLMGVLQNTNLDVNNFVNSYDGIYSNSIYVGNSFELSVQEREGIRSSNLKGMESSSRKFNSIDVVSVDSMKPEIYFIDNGATMQIIIDGTLSFVDKNSIDIKIDGVSVSSFSYCSNYDLVSIADTCVEIAKSNNVEVIVLDLAGNSAGESFGGSYDTVVYSNHNLEIFFNGNDLITSESKYFVQGQLVSGNPITNVMAQGKDCDFDERNFVCLVNLVIGENLISVTAENLLGDSVVNSYTIARVENNLDITLDDAKGYGVFKSGSQYFINLNLLDVTSSISSKGLIKVLVDGNENLYGNKVGTFDLSVNLGENVFGKDYEELDLWVEAEDELGNKGVSSKIKLIYNRVLQTILKVIVG